MIRVMKKSVLALEAVLDIAYNARPEPVQSREITDRQGIPNRYLEQVLQQLVRAGILRGVRGPRGGYTLARERRRITVAEVIRVTSSLDTEDSFQSNGDLGTLVIGPLCEQAYADILARFETLTLEDLCVDAREKGIKRADGSLPDYSI
ncbi:RrF2 family transcriptional regulator [Amaricoccus macauensis]|uniref:RrF2 family transcriptional regulator n=1 Tax=Amaricoccus macauensis TaxID=57001 RepID=UPI003C7DF3CE